MSGTLIELTLGKSESLESIDAQSFNNDSRDDEKRNFFLGGIPSFKFSSGKGKRVPSKYLFPNVHRYSSNEIYKSGDKIIVGEYCNKGVIVPSEFSVAFNQLYNCSPLISFIKGDKEYISFLHTWAISGDSDVVDKQVKHWMGTIAKSGDILETVFAPRKNSGGVETKYKTAIDDMRKKSQKTLVLKRNLGEISGIVNGEGVYFNSCGYHLWKK